MSLSALLLGASSSSKSKHKQTKIVDSDLDALFHSTVILSQCTLVTHLTQPKGNATATLPDCRRTQDRNVGRGGGPLAART